MSVCLRSLWAVALAVCAATAASPAISDDSPVWNLKAEQFVCLQAHVDAYLALEGEPVVIFPAACPETDLVKIMADSSKNMAIAEVDRQEDSAARPAEVITFTRAQLECLKRFQLTQGLDVVQVPRDPCQ